MRVRRALTASTIVASAQALSLEAAVVVIPHPAKVASGGEDAWFAISRSFGVFDGVGGWQEEGVDPGLFSRAFARATADAIQEQQAREPTPADVGKSVDLEAAMTTGLSRVKEIGTSTACIVHISADGIFQAFNVGDSGFRLLRPDVRGGQLSVHKRSREQQHYFNCPFQLGTRSRDRPSDGEEYSATVQPGDLIVLVTDGVTDNLSDAEICDTLRSPLAAGEPAAALAQVLASCAHAASLETHRNTPFTEGARRQGFNYPGGKPDDVTVLCVKIVDDDAVFNDTSLGESREAASPAEDKCHGTDPLGRRARSSRSKL